jgi:hypothetical protein
MNPQIPPAKPCSTSAIVGFALALFSLIPLPFGFRHFAALLLDPLPPAAIALGIVGLPDADGRAKQGRGLSVAVIGVLPFAAMLVVLAAALTIALLLMFAH